eukprot:5808658-Pyramimonas_sp.AAC.1
MDRRAEELRRDQPEPVCDCAHLVLGRHDDALLHGQLKHRRRQRRARHSGKSTNRRRGERIYP